MPAIDLVVETELSRTIRARQVEAMFDVPPSRKCRLEWKGDLPIDAGDWNIGLIVGPSGIGKSSIAKQVFGSAYHPKLEWSGKSVIDDFGADRSLDQISAACQAVGFNTIPAWLRPYAVLSTGERFRVDLARRLLELPDPIVMDEFSSVVDRQVAKIGAHAVQKFIRRQNRKFVAVSCHQDILDWLQPDWIFEPATMHFARRDLQRRPKLAIVISRIHHSAWKLFSPFHYMSAKLHVSARCFGLWADGQLAAFAATLHRPHPKRNDITGVSRVVTLPDWQGLGFAFVLLDSLGSAYRAIGKTFRNYPAHPAFVRASTRSLNWSLRRRPGQFSAPDRNVRSEGSGGKRGKGSRPCAVFEYVGPIMDRCKAEMLLAV